MSTHTFPGRRRGAQSGFSLIEIMVAVLVLSVGLLGMAALMATSLRNTQSAEYRSIAVNLAHDAFDMMRADLLNASRYRRTTYTSPTASCPGDPAPFNYAASGPFYSKERNYWARKLCQQLPNGRGRITMTGTGFPAPYQATVEICWTDNRTAADVDTATCPTLAAGEFGRCTGGAAQTGAVCVIRLTSAI